MTHAKFGIRDFSMLALTSWVEMGYPALSFFRFPLVDRALRLTSCILLDF